MYIQWYVHLEDGDSCVVAKEGHPYCGRVVRFKRLEYVMQFPIFVFETTEGERVALPSEHDFTTVPYEESVRCLIDLALRTRDEAWFRELLPRIASCRLHSR